jgi:hypothetical protein
MYHTKWKCTILSPHRKEIGDPDVEYLIRDKDLVNKTMENGIREDLLPFLKDIYPSRRYTIIKTAVDKVFDFLRSKLEEHKETFDSSTDFCGHFYFLNLLVIELKINFSPP